MRVRVTCCFAVSLSRSCSALSCASSWFGLGLEFWSGLGLGVGLGLGSGLGLGLGFGLATAAHLGIYGRLWHFRDGGKVAVRPHLDLQ